MTDIIEDIENLLERSIDFLYIILRTLQERITHNQHRPLNRRNLVRWIAAFFPAPKNHRVQLQLRFGSESNTLSRWGSTGSLRSSLSSGSLQFVEEDLGDNMIRLRRENDYEAPVHLSYEDVITSTPNFNFSSASHGGQAASSKLADMEEQLASLRQQIALLVMAQENPADSQTITADQSICSNTSEITQADKAMAIPLPVSPISSSPDSGCDMRPPPPPPPVITALPPPPPPPPLPSKSDLAHMLREKRKASANRRTSNSPCRSQKSSLQTEQIGALVPNMCHVLKDLANVRLRAVDRSPGGTPIRPKPRSTASDPASIIALALKKKFAHQMIYSPDSDKENDNSSFNSPEAFNPVAGMYKSSTSRRKLNLAKDDSCDWTPVVSPVAQHKC